MSPSIPSRPLGRDLTHLALASLVLLFANGRWSVWPASWLGLALMIGFFRRAGGRWRPWLLGGAALWMVGALSWLGLIPFPPPIFLAVVTQWTALGLLPFALDRSTRRRSAGALQTLVFPASLVSLDFIGALRSGATWGNLAYTQGGFLPLAQLAAVTGLWGVGFLVAWFASWVNQVWEQREAGGRVGRAALVYPALLALVLAGGQIRIATGDATEATVRVATVTPPDLLDHLDGDDLAALQGYAMKQDVDEERLVRTRERLEATYPELLQLTRRAAQRRAEIVFWPEASLIVFGDAHQERLLDEARSLAREERVYLGASIALFPESRERLNENKVVLLSPEGRALGTYFKTRLVPHVEEPYTRAGDGRIGTVPTPWGLVATVICYDLDDPRYVSQLAGRGVAMLFAPSGDWPAIARLHAAMARFRAIETGIPLVRPANHGLTEIVDGRGRVLARMDHEGGGERMLLARVAPGSVPTLYPRWGDAFGWACLAAVPLLVAALWLVGRDHGGTKSHAASRLAPGRARDSGI